MSMVWDGEQPMATYPSLPNPIDKHAFFGYLHDPPYRYHPGKKRYVQVTREEYVRQLIEAGETYSHYYACPVSELAKSLGIQAE